MTDGNHASRRGPTLESLKFSLSADVHPAECLRERVAHQFGAGHCVSPTSTCACGRTSVSPPTNELRPIPHDLVDRRLPEARDLLEVGGLHEEQALRRVYRAIHQRPDRALAEAPVSKRKRLQHWEG